MTFVDVHVHLPQCAEREETLRSAAARSMCLVSCTVKASEAPENFRIKSLAPETVKCFVGVHPSDATMEVPGRTLGPFFEACDGIGEIGLDEKYSSTSPGGGQMQSFLDQLGYAETLGKPVQVHSRGSERECLDVLGTFNLKGVLMHWFEGEALVPDVVSRGYFVSVGPALLYSKKIRRIARAVASESLLTESDGPVPFGPLGGVSGPSLIPSVLLELAEIKGLTYERMEEQVELNAKRFLRVERLI